MLDNVDNDTKKLSLTDDFYGICCPQNLDWKTCHGSMTLKLEFDRKTDQ